MNRKMVKGGQGRSSHSLHDDAGVLLWLAAAAVAMVLLAIVKEVFSHA